MDQDQSIINFFEPDVQQEIDFLSNKWNVPPEGVISKAIHFCAKDEGARKSVIKDFLQATDRIAEAAKNKGLTDELLIDILSEQHG